MFPSEPYEIKNNNNQHERKSRNNGGRIEKKKKKSIVFIDEQFGATRKLHKRLQCLSAHQRQTDILESERIDLYFSVCERLFS